MICTFRARDVRTSRATELSSSLSASDAQKEKQHSYPVPKWASFAGRQGSKQAHFFHNGRCYPLLLLFSANPRLDVNP